MNGCHDDDEDNWLGKRRSSWSSYKDDDGNGFIPLSRLVESMLSENMEGLLLTLLLQHSAHDDIILRPDQ